jgi:hypothetical protein
MSIIFDHFDRYVLLKERNRLLTMEEEYRYQHELFPSPERIDKVNNRFDLLNDDQ